MDIRYFKNGNINIKFDADELHEINELKIYRMDCIQNEVYATLMNSAELDFIPADIATGCAGNYNMYYAMFNAYTGLEYTPLDIDFLNAAAGKTLKLYAQKITDVELKENYSEYYND